MSHYELMILLRETIMRNHMALPENTTDEKWFDEGWSMKDTPEYLRKVYRTLGLGNYTNYKNEQDRS